MASVSQMHPAVALCPENVPIRTVRPLPAVLMVPCTTLVRVEMKPQSAVRIEGGKFDEQIFLLKGEVLCDINRNTGAFSVETPAGKVWAR